MLLTIDIGNTNMTCGLFRGSRLVTRWQISTDLSAGVSALEAKLAAGVGRRRAQELEGICICSVVPRLDPLVRRACRNVFALSPLIVTWKSAGISIKGYDRRQVGVDRLVAAAAAYARYRKAIIVIDAGTAITIDAVSAKGEFLGGVIVPGLATAAAALHAVSEKLPLVEVRSSKRVIGKDTRSAIRAGILHGTAGLVDHLVSALAREVRIEPFAIATGGDARLLRRRCRAIRAVHLHLVLEGLRHAWRIGTLPTPTAGRVS